MTTLDQRILIPAAPNVVWDYVSNISNNPKWQADCESLSFLTSARNGRGTRWRYSSSSRREYVVEVTAWYDGLGYEYTIVDGVPYTENRGRIRLQEIPEGTIVQWTFNYETGGVLGGLRNRRGQVEGILIDSLRELYRQISKMGAEPIKEAKSLMRDAPDVEARAQYKPRHPSAIQEPQLEMGSVIPEPLVADDDTRPNKAVTAPSPSPVTPMNEPDFLSGVTSFEAVQQTQESMRAVEPPSTEDVIFQRPADSFNETQTAVRYSEVTQQNPSLSVEEPVPASPVIEAPPTEPAVSPDQSKVDTGKVSVFDVFGLPKPSETQEMRAITSGAKPVEITSTEPIPAVATESPVIPEPPIAPSDTQPTGNIPKVKTETIPSGVVHRGMRFGLRRKIVKVRYY